MKYDAILASLPLRDRSEPEPDARPPTGGIIKRGFDIIAAGASLILLAPLFGMLALFVKLSDGGSVFYGHRCICQNGRVFCRLKFRTMVEYRDEVLAWHFAESPYSRAELNSTRTRQNDPRVTRVGAVLQKLSLDELPQMINILRGDMSFVGPRPVREDELEMYGSAANIICNRGPA